VLVVFSIDNPTAVGAADLTITTYLFIKRCVLGMIKTSGLTGPTDFGSCICADDNMSCDAGRDWKALEDAT